MFSTSVKNSRWFCLVMVVCLFFVRIIIIIIIMSLLAICSPSDLFWATGMYDYWLLSSSLPSTIATTLTVTWMIMYTRNSETKPRLTTAANAIGAVVFRSLSKWTLLHCLFELLSSPPFSYLSGFFWIWFKVEVSFRSFISSYLAFPHLYCLTQKLNTWRTDKPTYRLIGPPTDPHVLTLLTYRSWSWFFLEVFPLNFTNTEFHFTFYSWQEKLQIIEWEQNIYKNVKCLLSKKENLIHL